MGLLDDIRRIRGDAPWMWTNASLLAADVEVDAGAAARWLPTGLRPSRPARATLFVADYPETSFGCVYREAAVLLHARFGPREVRFCPWMLVDDDRALILGRELLGYPKKLGAFTWDVGDGRAEASVSRNDVTLLAMAGDLGDPLPEPPPLMARPTMNVWGAVGLTPPWLLAFTPKEQILEARRADLTVTVRGSETDPLHELDVGAVIRATHYVTHMGGGKALPLPVLPVNPRFLFRHWNLRFH